MGSRVLHLLIIDIPATGVPRRLSSAGLRPLLQDIKKNLCQKRYEGAENRDKRGTDGQDLDQDAGASASNS